MEEMYWRQFLETGKVADYLIYRNICEKEYEIPDVLTEMRRLRKEETCESDYSDRDGAFCISYR